MSSHYEENISYDLGNLAAFDIRSIETQNILAVSIENAKKLLSKITALPKEEDQDGEYFILPDIIEKLPRAKAPPEEKPLTKWEKFRVSKGLGRRKKRSRLVYEPSVEGYVPRYGGYSIKKLKAKQNGIVEDREGENPAEKAAEERALMRHEQKKRELMNKMVTEGKKDKKSVKKSIDIAKSSVANLEHVGKKRVHKNHRDVGEEKGFYLDVLDMVKRKK